MRLLKIFILSFTYSFYLVFSLSITFVSVYRLLTCTNRASTNLGSVLRKELRESLIILGAEYRWSQMTNSGSVIPFTKSQVLIYSINNEMFYGLRLASRNVSLVKL